MKRLAPHEFTLTDARRLGKVCAKHPGLNGMRMKSNGWCLLCLREKQRARVKKNHYHDEYMQRLKAKADAFAHYGRKCAHCGIEDPDVLTIDHTDQNGAEHRRAIGKRTGVMMCMWLKRNGWPSGFRTLCLNCNMKAYIVHQRLKRLNA